jgi:hypothetical protein
MPSKKIDPSADLITRAASALRIAGPDAVLASHTAVHLYGCTAARSWPIHVLMRSNRRIRLKPGLVVHRGPWEGHQTEAVHNLRTLSLEYALADMLCRADSPTAFLCLTQAIDSHPEGFKDLVRRAVLARPDCSARRRAEILLHLSARRELAMSR